MAEGWSSCVEGVWGDGVGGGGVGGQGLSPAGKIWKLAGGDLEPPRWLQHKPVGSMVMGWSAAAWNGAAQLGMRPVVLGQGSSRLAVGCHDANFTSPLLTCCLITNIPTLRKPPPVPCLATRSSLRSRQVGTRRNPTMLRAVLRQASGPCSPPQPPQPLPAPCFISASSLLASPGRPA